MGKYNGVYDLCTCYMLQTNTTLLDMLIHAPGRSPFFRVFCNHSELSMNSLRVSKCWSLFFSSLENQQAVIVCWRSQALWYIICNGERRSELNSEMLGDVLCRNSFNCQCLYGVPCGIDFCLNGLLFAFQFTSPLRDVSMTPARRKWYLSDKSRNILYDACNTPAKSKSLVGTGPWVHWQLPVSR